jgi:uncharacterized membrane protein YcaP (DUF421 family)
MWALDTPWYELVIRASSVFLFLFIVCRIWGRKHLGQLSPFDFILLLIISECFQSALQGEEKSITGGMIALTTLVLLNSALTRSTYFSKRAEKFLDGEPKILVKDGVVNEELREKQFLSYQDLYVALRMEGVIELKDVIQATIEPNGRISVVRKHD